VSADPAGAAATGPAATGPGATVALRTELAAAARVLRAAGVDSPRTDAELLAAHLLGIPRGRLPLLDTVPAATAARLCALIARRAAREPLQHLLGHAPMGQVDVAVGPGVFVPRPETELILDAGLRAVAGRRTPVVIDLCSGSGALALAVAAARPDARVHAVENDPAALSWLRRNAAARAAAGDTPITVHDADVTDPGLPARGLGPPPADLILCNPPYVPAGTPVPPEVADHDPPAAVFAGPDGLAVIGPVAVLAAALLAPGGCLVIEHDETHAPQVAALLAATTRVTAPAAHRDLAGRPRYTSCRRR
jgi:release factor glutamine methyltransferase